MMKPWQQRVVTEKAELDDKLNKLAFFFPTPDFRSLDPKGQGLLHRQYQHMAAYAEVLGERISHFEDDCSNEVEAKAKRYLAGRPPMSGHYMGVSFDRFTTEEILKIWRECDGMFRFHQEQRTASPAPGRSSASDSEPDRAAGRRANRDIGDQGPSRG